MDKIVERVEEDRIILNKSGKFPKEILFIEQDKNGYVREKDVRILRKTAKGGFLLNK